MLAAPTKEEYEDFLRAVEIMTEEEKSQPEKLTDEEVRNIAERAHADCGNINIFINGYILARKKTIAAQK